MHRSFNLLSVILSHSCTCAALNLFFSQTITLGQHKVSQVGMLAIEGVEPAVFFVNFTFGKLVKIACESVTISNVACVNRVF